MVFGSCCDRFVPPECRGLCTYESHPIEARVLVCLYSFFIKIIIKLMHTIQPSRCRLYKYLPAIVHCAAQTHDNTVIFKNKKIFKY
jgi:hypothetical protein